MVDSRNGGPRRAFPRLRVFRPLLPGVQVVTSCHAFVCRGFMGFGSCHKACQARAEVVPQEGKSGTTKYTKYTKAEAHWTFLPPSFRVFSVFRGSVRPQLPSVRNFGPWTFTLPLHRYNLRSYSAFEGF